MRIKYEGSNSEHVMPQRHQNSVNNLQPFKFQGHEFSHTPGVGWKTSTGILVYFMRDLKKVKTATLNWADGTSVVLN
jgi:hypothetical protein